MAFVKVSTILQMADRANTAAIGFNCVDYNTIYSVVAAAQELNKPVICMLYPEHEYRCNVISLAGFAAIVRDLAEKVSVPVGVHLDHSSDYDYIIEAIRCGFNSVMYDGSMLPLEENIANTRKVVEAAAQFDAEVEAELGYVGFASHADQDKSDLYTQPEVAARFVRETNVNSLAVAIGSAHGFYTKTPKLDLERLDKINRATDVHLVMHGGSGIPQDQVDQAFRLGINKFNVGTEFLKLYKDSTCKHSGDQSLSPEDFAVRVQADLIAYLREKLLLTKV